MDKKVLLAGSLSVVVIIILASFTTVVGFQTGKSNAKHPSPLFTVRTERTLNKEQKVPDSNYLGEDKPISIITKKEDSRTVLLQKITNVINRMDDKTFNWFLDLVINRLQQEPNINDITIFEIVTLFEQLRDEPMKLEDYIMFQKIDSDIGCNTYCVTYCTGTVCPTESSPFCWIFMYFYMILVLIIDIFEKIFNPC